MEKFVWLIENDQTDENWKAFVRATDDQIEVRKYFGEINQFAATPYADSKDFPRGSRIDGEKVLSIREFDKFRHEHHLDCCGW